MNQPEHNPFFKTHVKFSLLHEIVTEQRYLSKPYFYKPTRLTVVCVCNLVYHVTYYTMNRELFHLASVLEFSI